MPFPSRIVCLTEETTETLYLLGEQARIVGISGYTVRPPEARDTKPRVGGFTSARIERIAELKPDLVLGFSDLQVGPAALTGGVAELERIIGGWAAKSRRDPPDRDDRGRTAMADQIPRLEDR